MASFSGRSGAFSGRCGGHAGGGAVTVPSPAIASYDRPSKTLAGTAEPGATVNILADGVATGTATANGAGAWSYVFGTAPATGVTLSATQTKAFTSGSSNLVIVPPASVSLGPLNLSALSFTEGATAGTVIGAIQNKASGSTVDISPADGRVALSGSNVIVGLTPASIGAFSFTLVETLAGATNTPRSTTITLTVNAADAGPFPSFAPAFLRVAADDGGNTVETTDQTFAPSAVDTANSKIALPGLTYAAAGAIASIAATRVTFSSTGTLPAPLVADTPYLLSLVSGNDFELYPEAKQSDWSTTPTMLADDAPMPAQNYFQRVNKVVLTSQGSGTHRVKSLPLMKEMPNLIAGKPAYKIGSASTDRHNRFEIVTDGRGDKALLGRILARDPSSNGAYNLYGFGIDQSAGDQRIAFQTESRSKRTLVAIAVLRWDESETYGLAKVPLAPSAVNTSTGVLTFTAHGMTTGWRVRLLAHVNGGVLPTGFAGGTQDYWVRSVTANTMTLHTSSADATAGTNPVIPTAQGSVGFLVYAPERPGDVERMRFLGEWRNPANGGNSCTVRTNAINYGDQTYLASDVTVSGSNNGNVGATGRTSTGLVPTTSDVAKVRIRFPAASVAPTRSDTGQPLASGEYWIRRHASSVAVVLYDTQAACLADLGLAPAASSCIKFSAAGTGFFRLEQVGSRPFNASGERGAETLPANRWGPPIGQKGLLTALVDYDDPSSSFIRYRYYWNGALVADYQSSNGAKGVTGSGTSGADTGMTLMNSPQRHVSFEGLLYDLTLAASDSEISASDLQPVHNWLMAKYGIAA